MEDLRKGSHLISLPTDIGRLGPGLGGWARNDNGNRRAGAGVLGGGEEYPYYLDLLPALLICSNPPRIQADYLAYEPFIVNLREKKY